MEPTKTCPSCGTIAPMTARRCKECYHDYTDRPPRRFRWVVPVLGAAFFASLVAAGLLTYITSYPADQKVLVDDTTSTIQWVRSFQDGHLETDRVAFADITKIRYVNQGALGFQIIAVTVSGEEKVVEASAKNPLLDRAERYAKAMNKPLEVVGEPIAQ